jgi:hypothetical protein
MNEDLTYNINNLNVQNIRKQINSKKSCLPFYATSKDATSTMTDYDTFPYTRWYRGVPESTTPVIAEREAGYRPRHDKCYRVLEPHFENDPNPYPNHCFAGPCSTVYPCYPEYLQKYSDKELLDTILNKSCVVQYR